MTRRRRKSTGTRTAALRQGVGILFDESLDQAVIAIGLVPFPCSPPDHAALMHVAGPVNVGTSLQKKADTRDVPMRGRDRVLLQKLVGGAFGRGVDTFLLYTPGGRTARAGRQG